MQLTKPAGAAVGSPVGTLARGGIFMLSFDCEGKWGLADRLTPRHERLYTTVNLESVYRRLTALLREYGIESTFAFTAAFTLAPDEFARLAPDLRPLRKLAAPWMERALAGIALHESQGWFSPACFEMVQHTGCHEIASHGFSHLPWKAPYASRAALDAELAMCRTVPAFNADAVKTFVFPRNQVAHSDLLAAHGFFAYRKDRPFSSRAAVLASEFNMHSPSELFSPGDQVPVPIPAGHFLNWRHGLRRCVPTAVTVRRWQNIVRHAARSGGIAHAWTHPENFMDGHDMFPMLEELLRFVAGEREAGRLQVLTNTQFLAKCHARTQAPSLVSAAGASQ